MEHKNLLDILISKEFSVSLASLYLTSFTINSENGVYNTYLSVGLNSVTKDEWIEEESVINDNPSLFDLIKIMRSQNVNIGLSTAFSDYLEYYL